MEQYALIDGEERSKRSLTFRVPPEAVRTTVEPGDYVKVGFELINPPADKGLTGERMWVRVEQKGDGRYHGYLDNDPVVLRGILQYRQTISFEPRHVLDVLRQNR